TGEEFKSKFEPEVAEKLFLVLRQIEVVEKITSPNEPLQGFILPEVSSTEQWKRGLALTSKETLIEDVGGILSEIRLPELEADEARHDHLRIYLQISSLQETLRSLISAAIALDYPHSLNVVAQTEDIAPQLREILQILTTIQSQTTRIEQQTTTKISDGIAVAIGPVSVSLASIKQAASMAQQRIHLNSVETNVTALVSALSQVKRASHVMVEQLQLFSRDVPQWLRAAIKRIVELGNEVAGRGLELMRTVTRKGGRREAGSLEERLGDGSPTQTLSEEEAREVGLALRGERDRQGITLPQAAGRLNLAQQYLLAIEEGRFGDLPGRTYAIGWVRAYATILRIDAEMLLRSVRRAAWRAEWLPEDPSSD
ncbi:MAG: helix-turn-helix domain-containing protein, partial [Alphaproteobacteria bacterium]|nr:helix-turn-helix domain-containing protein [Alphaproteobacteria bacterium]